MSFQWLQTRILEEKERRTREALIRRSLPRAFETLRKELSACVEAYRKAFGDDSAQLTAQAEVVHVSVRSEIGGEWRERSRASVKLVAALPGFQVENGGEPEMIEVGSLGGDKLFYKHGDQYLTMEQLTRRVLDKPFFPDLGE